MLETALLPGDGALRVRRGRPGARLNLPDAPDGFTLAHRAAGETWVHVPPAAQAAEGAAVPLSARSLRLDPDAPLRVTLGGFTVRFELLDRRRLPRR